MKKQDIKFSEKLLEWYDQVKRDLPWRQSKNPYSIWVSEIMCQQTRVDTVIDYYHRWMERIPDVTTLAATEDEVLYKLWQGLGYYNRVRNMKKAAQVIMTEHAGHFPSTKHDLNLLPGIGDYTSSAIASIAFEEHVPTVDGNVLRVMSRVLASKEDIKKNKTKEEIKKAIFEVMPHSRIGDFNQAMMELGALVCVPNGRPKCVDCLLQSFCKGFATGKPEEYPLASTSLTNRIEERTVFLVMIQDKWLIKKRSESGLLSNLWEYPNIEGHVNEEEVRLYFKEKDLDVSFVEQIGEAKHVFSHLTWKMKGYLVRVNNLKSLEEGILVSYDEIKETYSIPTAFKAFTKYIERFKKE